MEYLYLEVGSVKRNIRIGLLGFGAMGKTHAFGVNNLGFYYNGLPFCAEIAGVCTTNAERAEAIAKEYGFGYGTDSEDRIINDPDIDVIDICTPNIYHYETIKKALAAGKHIYCEKPLTVDADKAYEIASLAKSSGKICTVVFNNRFISPALKAKELIDEGKIGRVLSFSAEYLHNSCTDVNRPAGWKQNKEICGGGVLFDLGSHAIDMIYSLCGEFDSVYGIPQIAYPERVGADGKLWQTNADEAFYMICKLRSGACGTITVSKLVNGANDDLSISVYGEKGSLKFSIMDPNFLYYYDATVKPTTLGGECGYKAIECVSRYPAPGGLFPAPKATTDWLRGHVGSVYSFLSSVYEGKQTSPDFTDGAHVQAVMEAAYLSAEKKTEMKVK